LEKLDYKDLIKSFREYFGDQTPVFYFYAIQPNNLEQEKHIAMLKKEGYIIELGSFRETRLANGANYVHVSGIESLFVLRASTLPKEVKSVVLITGDGEFAPLIDYLQKVSKEIILITEIRSSYRLRRVTKSGVVDLKSFIDGLNSNKNPFRKTKKEVLLR